MVVWVLSISRRGAGPGILPRWGLLLAVLWVGGLLGCPGTGPQRARPPGEGPAAVALLRQQAGQGEREAQYQLGLLAFSGEGMPHDRHAAVQWLAARGGPGPLRGAASPRAAVPHGARPPAQCDRRRRLVSPRGGARRP